MTTALYLRLSSADEKNSNKFEYGDSDSIKNQRDLLTEFVKNHADLQGTEIIEICDDGFSGTNFERPGMKQLLELVKNGGVNCIVVKDFSRFGRNYIESGDYIEQIFPLMGVRFISVNDGYDSFTQDISAGNLNVAFMNLIHDLYSKDLSVKIKTSQRQKWEKGDNIAAHTIFGYVKSPDDKNKLIIDENAAAIVRQIFDMGIAGKRIREIVYTLNESGIPTPNRYKLDYLNCKRDWKRNNGAEFWNKSAVQRIIKDERYTGKFICGKRRNHSVGSKKQVAVSENEWVVKENAFEAIISEDTFIKVQQLLKERPSVTKQAKKQRIIYGKIRCAECGLIMQRRPYKNPLYVCETPKFKHSPNCVQKQILESDIENVLFEMIKMQIKIFTDNKEQRKIETDTLENKRIKKSMQLQELYKTLKQFEKERILLYETYKDEKITREIYLTEREKFNVKINILENEITELKSQFEKNTIVQINPIEQEYMRFAEVIEMGEVHLLTREIVDCLINSIIVYDSNKIEIELKQHS